MIRVSTGLLQGESRSKFSFVNGLLVVLFVFISGRVWYLQIFQGKKFRRFANENRVELTKIPAMRGKILDRNGIVIADSRPSFDLKVTPQNVEGGLESTLVRLSRVLKWVDADQEKLLSKFTGMRASDAVTIKYDLSRDELARFLVQQYAFPGVDVIHTPARDYPFKSHGSHLLGYLSEINKAEMQKLKEAGNVSYDLGDVWGIAGVEKKFDLGIRGENGSRPMVQDARGREAEKGLSEDLLPAFQPKEPVRGEDLVLAIDSRLQEAAEEAFAHDSGAVVALDPNNGEVLVLLSKPEFSPEKFVRGVSSDYWGELLDDPLNPLYDRALRGLYPPGSTFKFVTAMAALSEKVVQPEETVYCSGAYRIGREVKRCWKKDGHGNMNLHNALKQSCDVYFYEMGRRLGVDRIASYAQQFGMGQLTGIGINREDKGLVPTESWKQKKYKQPWVGGETLSVAIGQGFLQVTPIQLAVALSSLVNGGNVYRPQVALRTQNDQGADVERFLKSTNQQHRFDPKYVDEIRKGLVAVVNEEGGTGYWTARSNIVTIGGKTGTAQTVGKGSFKKLEDHAWFVAFAPQDNPKIVVSVIVEHAGHGGTVAAPIAKKIIETYLGGTS